MLPWEMKQVKCHNIPKLHKGLISFCATEASSAGIGQRVSFIKE